MSILDTIEKPKDRPVMVTICGDAGMGKAQPISEVVYTPNGPTPIGDIQVGDYVVGLDGCYTKVLGVYPQGSREVFRLEFRDGSSARSCAEHLWTLDTSKMRKTIALEDIIRTGAKKPSGQFKYFLPKHSAVYYDAESHYISPYIIGVLIGDGYLCGNGVFFSNPEMDSDIFDFVNDELPCDVYLSGRDTGGCNQYRMNEGDAKTKSNKVISEIKRLGLDVKSGEKFIPDEYMIDSEANRLLLLYGLMDTDGSTSKGRTSFHTSSTRLANDVANLVRSLGGVAKVSAYDRGEKGTDFRVNVHLGENPFRCRRKQMAFRAPKQNNMRRGLVSIVHDGFEDCVCIKVDAKDSLYLTKDYIPTHNTSLAATFPRPIFIRAEDGLQAIPVDQRPPAFPELTGFDHLMQQLTALIKEPHEFQTCVIDSISKLDIILQNELRKKEGKDNLAQCGGGFGGGFEIIAGQHQTVRRAAAAMQRRGMNVVFLAHADVETLKIPDADDYMRWTLRMGHKKSLPPYVEDVDVVGFLTLEKFVKGEDGRVKRAVSTGDRELICHAVASNVSKNRYGITEAIPVKLGENPLAQYIPALKNKDEQQ